MSGTDLTSVTTDEMLKELGRRYADVVIIVVNEKDDSEDVEWHCHGSPTRLIAASQVFYSSTMRGYKHSGTAGQPK